MRDRLPGFVRPIPFNEREFWMMQRAGLAVAQDAGKLNDAPFSGRKELLACELRRADSTARAYPPVR